MRWFKILIFGLHVLIGFYLLNLSLDWYPVPDYVEEYNDLLVLVGGIFVFIGGLTFLRIMRPRRKI